MDGHCTRAVTARLDAPLAVDPSRGATVHRRAHPAGGSGHAPIPSFLTGLSRGGDLDQATKPLHTTGMADRVLRAVP